MTSFKTTLHAGLAAAAIVGGVAMSGAASASPVTVDGITFDPSKIVLTIGTVYEDRVANIGDSLSGIGTVDAIRKIGGGTPTWQTGQNNVELTYTFSGFKLQAFVPSVGGTGQFFFSGGQANFYSDPAQNFTSSSGSQATDIASANGGSLFLSLDAGGTTTCGALGIICADGAGTIVTLSGTVNSATLGTVTAGSGATYFDVTGGDAAGNFDTDGIDGHDLQANFSFSTAGAQGTDYELAGSFDARALAIPEPGTLALFGASLIGLAAAGRRRRRSV